MRVEHGAIGIAGAGRIGTALGRILHDLGEPVSAIAGRDAQRSERAAVFIGEHVRALSFRRLPAHATRILIAVPDDALDEVAGILAEAAAENGATLGIALHTCGTRGPEALAPLEARGWSCGAIHPLQTVASQEQGLAALQGAAFAVTASGAALEWASRIAALLQGEVLRISAEQRPWYHAAAVMASNYMIALIDAAVILMGEAGIEEPQALRALAPLIRTSVENALAAGPLGALTGPIERGDTGTVAIHLRTLSESPLNPLYRAAGLHAVQMARRKTPGAGHNTIYWIEMERRLRE